MPASGRSAIIASTSMRRRPGYSGTALYARREPDEVVRGFGVPEFDGEGRYLEARFGSLSVVSLYLPSGSAGPERQASKFRFLEAFRPYLRKLLHQPAALHPVRRLEHRAQARSTCATGARIRRTPASCPRSAPGSTSCSATWATSTASARSMRARSVHVVVEPRPGLGEERGLAHRLSDREQPGLARQRAERATSIKAQRFSDHAPLIMDYDI